MTIRLALALVLALAAPLAAQQRPGTRHPAPGPRLSSLDTARLTGLRWRNVGPARGGRVTAVAGVAGEPHTFYMGGAGGGVWKTTDAGHSWRNVTDAWLDVGSIGAIAVAPSDPNVVWVGTGSEAIRSNVSIGHGVWRSVDAGKSWRFLGLRDVGQVGAVVVHPTNPEVAWVAAMGNPFRRDTARGVYRTNDGGKSWRKVLYLSDSTGAVHLALAPGNPNVVYAAMWRAERKPWTIVSGAMEGGIYRSLDGGDTWTRLTSGLPQGLVGKADIAISAAAPNRVWVLVEAKPGSGLYRSDDAGASFVAVDTVTKGIVTRPFYYLSLDVDPTDADHLWAGTEDFYESRDGGRTWKTRATPHGDNHDLWINPRDPRIMIQSNDGGANVTLDGGRSWSTQYNQPTAEIYQVAVDDQWPYRLYGAQQDNTTVIVPSLPPSSIPTDDPMQLWQSGPGCETGPIAPHPTKPDTVWGACKGQFSRMSLRTGQEQAYWIGAQSLYGNANADLLYRFQRVSPLEVSRDGRTVYYGSQYVHRTRDGGVTWDRISPDLTANDPAHRATISGTPITIDVTGEEMYATLYAIRESPRDPAVLWTGANDGPFFVTRDAGAHWTKVTPRAQPPGCRVQNIEPSPHRTASAYYAAYCYLLGDFKPYLWKTDDWGATWTLLTDGTNGIAPDEPMRVVREDPVRPGLLYAGTEFGAYVSFDDGGRWWPLQRNLPHVPVTDLRVHDGDLAISTQGRSFWILDDVAPLRQLSDSVAASRLHLFAPRTATRMRYPSRFGGAEQERATAADPEFPPPGAMLDYWLGDTTATVRLEVRDSAGRLVRTFSSDSGVAPSADSSGVRGEGWRPLPPLEATGAARLPRRAGLNRFTWDLAWAGPWQARAARSGREGPLVAPGRYTLRLTSGGAVATRALVVREDPRVTRDGITDADLRATQAVLLRLRDLESEVNLVVARVERERRRLAGAPGAAADTLARLDSLQRALVTPPVRYSRPALQAHIQYLYQAAAGADQRVGKDVLERERTLRAELDRVERELGALERAR